MSVTINDSILSPAGRLHLGRRVKFGFALVLASLGVVGGVPSVSSAYVDTSTSGRIGPVTAPASTVRPGMTFYVPGVTVGRNGAAAAGQAQEVVVTYYLQRYNGRSWALADQIGQAGTIQQSGNAVTVPPITLVPRYIAATVGYWRVAYAVQWRGPWRPIGVSAFTGVRVFIPSLVSDMRCGVATCRAYAGSLYIW